MPYVKCVSCRIRVSTAGAGTDIAEAWSCPGCGLSLEPVAKLTEVLGFRSPDLFHSSGAAKRVADISGGRAVAQAQLDTDRLLAVAMALPRPTNGA